MKALNFSVLEELIPVDNTRADALIAEALSRFNKKIVVLDDDPTGVQTVHGVSVYTDWSTETLCAGFLEDSPIFFVLTNSRGMTQSVTREAHTEIAKNLVAAANKIGKEFIVISRSDSTLRGHYPLETEVLRSEIEALCNTAFDGEIILPFFLEGGRFTIGNVHYVKDGDMLTPAGETEFARDKTFGYSASHLGEWCEEKSGGAYKAADMTYISIEELRCFDIEGIAKKLCAVTGFNKVICNAASYADVKVFAAAYVRAAALGKNFMLRSAAAITKVLGGIPDRPLLTRDELIEPQNRNGGLVIIGSHVNKTTQQLETLRNSGLQVEFIEFDQHRILEQNGLAQETLRVSGQAGQYIANGKTTVIFTRRDRFDLDTDDKNRQLEASVQISDAVTACVSELNARPSFIIAKGGITSSDIGTKALDVKKAIVMGQAAPGIPVWMTGSESRFANMPYIIFPGNVGNEDTLLKIVESLTK